LRNTPSLILFWSLSLMVVDHPSNVTSIALFFGQG
jgi:hypothetical protein